MPYFLLAAALVVLDQLVKLLVLRFLPLGGRVPLIPHLVELTYVQNTGAAFSLFSRHTWVLAVVSALVAAALIVALQTKKVVHPLGRWPLALVLAGAVGNLIDRAFRGFVVDMFNVLFMRFAVFNVADICVVVGGIGLALYYILLADKLEPKEASHDRAHSDH